jgi:hypothetical protein
MIKIEGAYFCIPMTLNRQLLLLGLVIYLFAFFSFREVMIDTRGLFFISFDIAYHVNIFFIVIYILLGPFCKAINEINFHFSNSECDIFIYFSNILLMVVVILIFIYISLLPKEVDN